MLLFKSDVKSFDFVVIRFLMKLFRTVNHDVIHDYYNFLEFILPSDQLTIRLEKLIVRFTGTVIPT